MKTNESWIRSIHHYTLPTPITFNNIEIYVENIYGDIVLIATAKEITFKWMLEVMKDMYPRTGDGPKITNFAGKINGIDWGTESGPARIYYQGNEFFMARVHLKWNDGEAEFHLPSYISFRTKSGPLTNGNFGGKLYSVLPTTYKFTP